MISRTQIPKPILASCLLILIFLVSGCSRLVLPVILPANQPAVEQGPTHARLTQPVEPQSPVTATPLPTPQPPARPIYVVDPNEQEKLSRIFMIDPDQARIVWTITARYLPEAAVSPGGARLFIADSYWTQVTRGEQRDVLSVFDAHSGELLVDDIPIQDRLLYKVIPSAQDAFFFLSGDGRSLFVGKYGQPDIHQFRLAVFDAATMRLLYEGAWPSCTGQNQGPYDRQACDYLSSQGAVQHHFAGTKFDVPRNWKITSDMLLSPDGKRLFVGFDTGFPEADVFTDTIVAYDAATMKRLGVISLPGPVNHFALSKAGDQLYAVSPFTRSLSIYNTETLQELAVMKDLGGSPALILVPGGSR